MLPLEIENSEVSEYSKQKFEIGIIKIVIITYVTPI